MQTINQSVSELVSPSASVPFYSQVKQPSIDQSVSLLILSFVRQFVSKLVSHLVSQRPSKTPWRSMALKGQQRRFSNGKLNYFCSDRPVSQRITVRKNQLLVQLENNYSLTRSNGQAAVQLGSLSNKDDDKLLICVLSNFFASIWNRSICQMQATFPGAEFLRTLFIHMFKQRKGKFVVVCPRPIKNVALGGFTSQWCTGRQLEKCTKKRDARAELLF